MTRVDLYKSKVFVIIWHLIAVVQYNYAIYYEHNYVVIPDYIQARMPNMGGKSRFLTYWCLVCLLFNFFFLIFVKIENYRVQFNFELWNIISHFVCSI